MDTFPGTQGIPEEFLTQARAVEEGVNEGFLEEVNKQGFVLCSIVALVVAALRRDVCTMGPVSCALHQITLLLIP